MGGSAAVDVRRVDMWQIGRGASNVRQSRSCYDDSSLPARAWTPYLVRHDELVARAGMKRLCTILVLLAIATGLVSCGSFPPPGNGRGILNDPDPMMGGGG